MTQEDFPNAHVSQVAKSWDHLSSIPQLRAPGTRLGKKLVWK